MNGQRGMDAIGDSAGPRELTRSLWLRVPLALAALAAIAFVLQVPDERTPWWGLSGSLLDVNVYRWGGHAALSGIPLYEGLLFGFDPGRGYAPMPFTYPPFSALLFTPLTQITTFLMEASWFALCLAALYLAVRLCLTILGYRPDRVTKQVALCLAACCLVLEPVRTTLWLGQINLVLLVLILSDQLLSQRGSVGPRRWWHRFAGVGSGIAAGIKLTPAFFWGHWVATGRWKMAAAGIGAFAGTAVIGFVFLPGDSRRYWSGTMFESERIEQDATVSNQSLRGVLARLLDLESVSTTWWLVLAVAITVVALAIAAFAHHAGHTLLALTLSGMTMSIVSPFSWGHHWVWFVPLLVLAVHHALDARRRLVAWAAPLVVLAVAGAWVQSFPNPDFPDGRWVAIGLFMHDYAGWGPLDDIVQNIYPLAWLGVLVWTVVVTVAARRASARETSGQLAPPPADRRDPPDR